MTAIIQSKTFSKWLAKLRDEQAKALIARRLMRLRNNDAGDVKSIGEGISEMRIHLGPGYRIYYLQDNLTIVVLLCGGDKKSQPIDIKRARHLAEQWRLNHG
jgi:putative addiction module killer protein